MADKPKRPERFDLKSASGRSSRFIPIAATAFVVLLLVGVVFWIVHNKKGSPAAVGAGGGDTVRVTSSKLVTQPGTSNPKALMSFYEDFLCPACGNFERTFGPTVSKLIDIGAIEADYSMVAILDSGRNQNYSSRAGAAALCVADESLDAFRRFHTALYSTDIQPSETGSSFPDNARLIELARENGAAGKVPDCVNSGKYLSKVTDEAGAAGIHGTPTVKINGQEYQWSTPAALVAKIKEIVGDVPGIDSVAASAAS
ncbi:MAG: DsbA family protein [Mycobacterium sp.]|uniref:DsbA family protein n=1 Tax=Mycobacterium sp. TaxID=1785 RepID=UPI001EBE92AA|nr:DsbA family protein [Mycobacterium sp.]MBW0017447.1 DsbA family protein [Mycobacterium sp.]